MKTRKRSRLPFAVFAAAVLLIASIGYERPAQAAYVVLEWDENTDPDLAGYKIYYRTGGSGGGNLSNYTGTGATEGNSPIIVPLNPNKDENPGDPNLFQFTLHNLEPDKVYFFVVTAFDTGGLESVASNEVATDYSGPGRVINLSSSPPSSTWSNDNTVTVSWTAPSGMPLGISLAGYSTVWDMASGTTPPSSMTIGAVTSTTSPALLDGNRYYFHIRAVDSVGTWGDPEHYGPFWIDIGWPSVSGSTFISGTTVEITYSEYNMQNAAVAGNYSLDNGATVSGVTDVTGEGRTFRLSLSNVQSYMIYTMTITSGVTGVVDAAGKWLEEQITFTLTLNDDDSDGMADDWEIFWFGDTTSKNGTADTDGDGIMDVREYNIARANPRWGAARWTLSPRNWDSDGDGISDKYETDYGMNPVDPADGDPSADLDGDGWTNHEEYLYGYAANNANSPVPAPPQVREVIPSGNGPVPDNSTVAVRVEATQGINMAEPSGVTVTVNDGNSTYARNLNNDTVKAIPLDSGVTTSRSLWIAYYRSNETANEYPSGVTVTVTFEATDVRKDSMIPETVAFRIETQEEQDEAAANLPVAIIQTDYPSAGLTTSGVTNTRSMLDGAAIVFDNTLPAESGVTPYIGPAVEVPAFSVPGYTGVGVAMNLLPPTVFPNGVTLMIPCPGYSNVSGLYLYYYNGQQWVMACDSAGNVQPGGVGWMVLGSRVNHNGTPAFIEIEVYHFSAVIAATPSGTTVTVETGAGGGGCFISSIME
jgi:hypothetical protein